MTLPHRARWTAALGLVSAALHLAAAGPYPTDAWPHVGTVVIDTTATGAALPAEARVSDFPLRVRLSRETFRFEEAAADGADLRFSTPAGQSLAYEVERWAPAQGVAEVWVRIPEIRGDARQEVRLHWGNTHAASESSGPAVFDTANGHVGVWHMGDDVRDATGPRLARDTGTTPAPGVVGAGRHFPGGRGLALGETLTHLPTGVHPSTTEAWFRAESPNATLVGWGNEQAQGKVVLQFRSPPHVNVDGYFSDANVRSRGPLPLGKWVHVVHVHEPGRSRLYIDGVLDGDATAKAAPLSVRSPAGAWVGGWHGHYDFVGDIDEVRISDVARSPEWIRLEHENQKPLPTLVGWVVPSGVVPNPPVVTPAQVTLAEGGSAELVAEPGRAEKVSWSLLRDGIERVVATDQRRFRVEAGRVTGAARWTVRFKAVEGGRTHVRDIPVAVQESLPDPVVSLQAPARWDGRTPIEVVARVANQRALDSRGVSRVTFAWNVSGPATIHAVGEGRLRLERAQGSGPLVIQATVDNGGAPSVATATLRVQEPRRDAWIPRPPEPEEHPEDNQFYARDDHGTGTLVCAGRLEAPADAVFVRVHAGDHPYRTRTARPGREGRYRLAVPLRPGLVEYRMEFGVRSGGREHVLRTATNLVCGDAYIVQGQSNAVATDWGPDEPPSPSEWVRTFGSGSMGGNLDEATRWGMAVARGRDTEAWQVGYWGLELGRQLATRRGIPVCILNGAVGGTRIDQHQRDPSNPTNAATIYGRLLSRVRRAHLTHGIRGVFWHQGENDQGADGPTGRHGWETYREHFIRLAGSWRQDFPNLQHSYLFQIWPHACAMGVDGSDDRLREVQRTLPSAFSRWSVMSTLDIEPPGGCHFPAAGYAAFARRILPLVERDHHGVVPAGPITPPNLLRAGFDGPRRDQVRLEFDQPVAWTPDLAREFRLDDPSVQVTAGAVTGSTLTLSLSGPTRGRTIRYLDGRRWSQSRLLRGTNGLAALTFCDVRLDAGPPPR